jgi:OmpA-OmpF porin, OOP family
MNMKTKIYLTIIILCLLILTSNAQNECLEFEIIGGYGLSGLMDKIENGHLKSGLGYQFSLNSKFFFTHNFGAGIGAGYASFNSKAWLTSYSTSLAMVDDESENFEYRVIADGIVEKQTLSALEIPIFLAYRKSLIEKLGVYANAGLKLSFPLTATYECTVGTIDTRGYYSAYNVALHDMPNHGFGKSTNITYSGDLSTRMAYSIFANAGVTVPVGVFGFSLGVYGSYSLNSVLNPKSKQLMVYPGNYQSATSVIDKVSLVTVGANLGIQFRL